VAFSHYVFSPLSPPPVDIKPSHVVVAPLLSLSSVKIIFSTTVTSAAAATAEAAATTLSRSSFPSQRQPR